MDLSIRPIKPEEIPFSYTQSQNDNIESGCIGFLRGDFDTSGKGFYTTWEDKVKFLKTDEFKREFDDVINSLRFGYGELLKDRSSLSAYCQNNPDGVIEGNYTKEYGFRVDTDEHSYILRCNPTKGDYNFYVYAYDRETFEKHLNEIGVDDLSETYKKNPELCKKMKAEQDKYKDWLMQQSPEEILNHAYEYSVRNDILNQTQYSELSDELMTALLNSPSPLDDIYKRFVKIETDYIDTIDGCICETAFKSFEKAEEKKLTSALDSDHSKIPLYEKSFSEAMENNEVPVFRVSARADNMCKTAIEALIHSNYSDYKLNPEGARKVVEIYGLDRVKKILAFTCIVKDYDGRISPENKSWAKTVRPNDVKDKIDLSLVIDGVNPGLTDIFIRQVKKIEDEHKPSVLKKLETAKGTIAPASTVPKKKEQVL